jgi:hypothetical protein
MSKSIGGHELPNNGLTNEWLTPPYVLEALGPFDLDPCSPIDRPWDTAKRHYTKADDGLNLGWGGRVWLNPPYGQQTWKWLERMADHGYGTALTFARTETKQFHRYVWGYATALLFFEGRLHFYDVTGKKARGNAGAPSVLIAYGNYDAERLRVSGLKGRIVYL